MLAKSNKTLAGQSKSQALAITTQIKVVARVGFEPTTFRL